MYGGRERIESPYGGNLSLFHLTVYFLEQYNYLAFCIFNLHYKLPRVVLFANFPREDVLQGRGSRAPALKGTTASMADLPIAFRQ